MDIPTDFKNALSRKEKYEENERLRSLKEEEANRIAKKAHEENERQHHASKIELCKKIFAWKDEFLKTKEGAGLFRAHNRRIWVFGGCWAHGDVESEKYGSGCWSRIYFEEGHIKYWTGYKWMGGKTTLMFTGPEEMAAKLDYKYLLKLGEAIDTKRIFKNIISLNGRGDG